ncbi:MAG TPA: SIMPL domain-containing protein [Balneolales bacterium]|nr:SIMPL domain-containing protein [Balneolales bacterium]
MKWSNKFLLPSVILGISLLCSVIFAALVWRNYKLSGQTITVTGSASQEIVSNLGILQGSVQVERPTAENAYRELKKEMPELKAYLKKQGIKDHQIKLFPVNCYPVHETNSKGMRTNRISAYRYSQRIEVTSDNVQKIRHLSLDISSVVETGIMFQQQSPRYIYSNLAPLKIKIQSLAAKDAMKRAEEIIKATGRKLGPLSGARMGVIQITPVYSNAVSNYGINDQTSIRKEITGVVTATFVVR